MTTSMCPLIKQRKALGRLLGWLCGLVLGFTLVPQSAQAQLAVTDPTNLVQNTTSAIAEVNSTVQQIRSVALQVEQLKNELQNLKKLNPQNLVELQMTLNQVQGVINRTKSTARQWEGINQRFDTIYGKYAPPAYRGEEYLQKRQEWEKQTQLAEEGARQAQIDAAKANPKLGEESAALSEENKSVEGAMQAYQNMTNALLIMHRQQQVQLDLMIHQHRHQQMMQLEHERKTQAAQKRQAEAIGGGMGEYKNKAEAVVMPELP